MAISRIERKKSIVRKNSAGSEFARRRLNLIEGTNVTLTVGDDAPNNEVDVTIAASGGGAPTDADYLVGTANAGLSGEIVAGTAPGGELGGTWGSPTVDATHSGSAHTDSIAKAIVDAKGDLIVATAADTPSRLAIGANDQSPQADSAEATGIKWRTPVFYTNYVAGRYYVSTIFSANAATVLNNLDLSPFFIFRTKTFDQMSFWLQTAGAAGAVYRLGIYNDNGSSYPSTLVLDAGTVATDAGGGTLKTITISQSLSPGLYWVGGVPQTATSTVSLGSWAAQAAVFSPIGHLAAPTLGNQSPANGFRESGVSGALPATFTSTVTNAVNDTLRVWLRAA